jgi:hypothetical protein
MCQIRIDQASLDGFCAYLTPAHYRKIEAKLGQSTGSGSTVPILKFSQFKTIFDLTTLPSYTRSWAINPVVLRDILLEPVKESWAN